MSSIIKIFVIMASVLGVSLLFGAIIGIIIPQGFYLAITQVFSYFGLFNFIIPVPTIITLITLTLAFHTSMLGYKGVNFVINYFKPH